MSKPAKRKHEKKVLQKLREICSGLPGVDEAVTWGHPTFQAGKGIFAVFEEYKGNLCICFKTTLPLQELLIEEDPRFFKSPYIGKQGWVSLIVDQPPKWSEVKYLVTESYRLVTAPKPRSKRA